MWRFRALSILRKMLRHAEELEYLDKVPRFKLLKVPPQAFSVLEFEDWEHLVSVLEAKE